MSDDFEDNSETYEDYFNHMAGFDEDVHVPNKWVETGNFHQNMIINYMSTMPGGGPLDPPHKDQSRGLGYPAMPHELSMP